VACCLETLPLTAGHSEIGWQQPPELPGINPQYFCGGSFIHELKLVAIHPLLGATFRVFPTWGGTTRQAGDGIYKGFRINPVGAGLIWNLELGAGLAVAGFSISQNPNLQFVGSRIFDPTNTEFTIRQ